MSTYVMSDIHGCYNAFTEILKMINFSDEDQLILLGDYIDRGSQNIEMLQWIETQTDNVLLIKGNHEAEFAQCIDIFLACVKKLKIDIYSVPNEKLKDVFTIIKEYLDNDMFDYYGTIEQIISSGKVSVQDLINWKQIIDIMPYFFKTTINKKKFIFVHAGYITDEYFELIKDKYDDKESFYIYARDGFFHNNGLFNTTIIFGHTPTIFTGSFHNNGYVFKFIDKKSDCTYYNIDCGISYRSDKHINAKLACIRLEDEKIYYV